MKDFEFINNAYNSVFKPNRLSLGVMLPIENQRNDAIPTLKDHMQRAQLIDQLGFRALWARDVPFFVPTFGDAGQTFDPFTYLGFLAGQTKQIALGTTSIALPLHNPADVAKSAATIDQLSSGRLIMGVASGDRPSEYPALNLDFSKRGELFRDAFQYIRKAQEAFPILEDNYFGTLNGQADILPKPTAKKTPMLLTGFSQQSMEWNAEHADGWIYYPRNSMQQASAIAQWRDLVSEFHDYDKPFMQSLYLILEKDDDFKPEPIHLGLRLGANYLIDYLNEVQKMGVNHVVLNLRFTHRDVETSLLELAEKVLPHFHLETEEALE